MASNKPTRIPRWDGSAGVIEPSETKKNTGWEIEKPPFQTFNWIQRESYKWMDFLNRRFLSAIFKTDNNTLPRVATLTFDADFVSDNIITVAIDDAVLQVSFITDQATTMSTLATEIQGTDNVATATVTDTREITITSTGTSVFDILEVVVTDGASQPSGTVAITQAGAFYDHEIHSGASFKSIINGVEKLGIAAGAVIINEPGADVDTRIETSGNANALFIDGGTDVINIGGTGGAHLLTVHGDMGISRFLYHNGDSDTRLEFSTDLMLLDVGGGEAFRATTTDFIINEDGLGRDFRVEGDGDSSLIRTDAENDRVGVGTGTIRSKLHVDHGVNTSDASISWPAGSAPSDAILISSDSLNGNEGSAILFGVNSGERGHAAIKSLLGNGSSNSAGTLAFYNRSSTTGSSDIPKAMELTEDTIRIDKITDLAGSGPVEFPEGITTGSIKHPTNSDTRINISDDLFLFRVNNVDFMFLDNSGVQRVRILPELRLDTAQPASGTNLVISSGNIVSRETSSKKYKKNIQKWENPGDVLRKLEPKTFKYKKTDLERLSFIAEEVGEISPLLINKDEKGYPESLDSFAFIALLVEEIKEIKKRIDSP